MAKRKQGATGDATEIIRQRYYAGNLKRIAALENARESATIARQIHELRVDAGLTQKELARRIGTTSSVVSRLEDDDYEGHSLSMLRRVAAALNRQVELKFVPRKKKRRAA